MSTPPAPQITPARAATAALGLAIAATLAACAGPAAAPQPPPAAGACPADPGHAATCTLTGTPARCGYDGTTCGCVAAGGCEGSPRRDPIYAWRCVADDDPCRDFVLPRLEAAGGTSPACDDGQRCAATSACDTAWYVCADGAWQAEEPFDDLRRPTPM